MDRIVIDKLRVDAIIGIHDWERRVRQPLLISMELANDIRRAAASGDIADALDYSVICNAVQEHIQQSNYLLIEELAEALATLLMNDFAIPRLTLRIDKPGAVPQAQSVAVVIERGEV